ARGGVDTGEVRAAEIPRRVGVDEERAAVVRRVRLAALENDGALVGAGRGERAPVHALNREERLRIGDDLAVRARVRRRERWAGPAPDLHLAVDVLRRRAADCLGDGE